MFEIYQLLSRASGPFLRRRELPTPGRRVQPSSELGASQQPADSSSHALTPEATEFLVQMLPLKRISCANANQDLSAQPRGPPNDNFTRGESGIPDFFIAERNFICPAVGRG